MEYFIKVVGLPSTPEIKISEEEFTILRKSRQILSNALAIEEKYEMLISNYLTLEKQMLCLSSELMIRSNLDYREFFEETQAINLCMVNLLTSARLYVDQIRQNVENCMPGESEMQKKVKDCFSFEYDSNEEYRLMEALRNYVQHCGLPVHFISHHLSKQESQAGKFFEYRMDIFSSKSSLMQDHKFKRKVLDGFEEQIDLKSAVRSYIESLSYIQDFVRTQIKDSVINARNNIESQHKAYRVHYPYETSALAAIGKDVHGKTTLSTSLILDYDDIRVLLHKRNQELVNLKRRYVSNIPKTQERGT